MHASPEKSGGRHSTMRGRSALLCWLAFAAACGGAARLPSQLEFAPARRGVFVAAVPLVETPADDLAPSVAPDGARLAYAGKANGNLDIFVRPVGGGAAVRLTTHSTDDTDPAFSPDGKRIAWISQADDVKGDLWIMEADGSHKRRLTGRESADRAPAFSADGRSVYFTTVVAGELLARIDVIEIDAGVRRTAVPRAWDPAPSPDGTALFFAAPGDSGRPRLYALRLADGRVAPLTDGAYLEGMPRTRTTPAGVEVVFCRFVDDQDGSGIADASDPSSLWATRFDPALFETGSTPAAVPLTSGTSSEILASATTSLLAFTAGGASDLDIQALPTDGMVNRRASAEAILAAARSEDDTGLRRLALRYVIATAPALIAPARYELARELAERGKLSDAGDELTRVVAVAGSDVLGLVARIEIERLRMLLRLGGALNAREAADRDFVEQRLKAANTWAGTLDDARVAARMASFRAEVALALGKPGQAVAALEAIAATTDVTAEDGARALDRLGEAYERLGDVDAVARTGRELLLRFGAERFYAKRTAERWVAMAQADPAHSPLAALETIVRTEAELPAVAARAMLAMAGIAATSGRQEAAVERWRALVDKYPMERSLAAAALSSLGADAEARGDVERALEAYERLLAEFADERPIRLAARRGVVRISMRQAIAAEQAGKLEAARESYARLLENDRELVGAHRRYIALSAALGHLGEVLARYRVDAQSNGADKLARYGLGYALTFVRPLPLREAQREVSAALELDPRFAAAHLTMGWIRERLETEEPKRGWLEAASDSYRTAEQLVDRRADPELWAAATLNLGNTLFALGKEDLAFAAYLARELSGVAHDTRLGELTFRESFARVALRQEAHDIAIDMAAGAHRLALQIPGEPRRAATAALLGATHLVAGMYEETQRWYAEAAELYRSRADWGRVVPLLRGRALAEQALGRFDEALDTLDRMLAILARGEGPHDPHRSIFITEIPGNPVNVTRGVYGFSKSQEEELARSVAARIHRELGNSSAARAFDARRLVLLRKAADDEVLGPRIGLELVLALHESARLAARTGASADAAGRLGEGLAIAKANGWWSEAALLLESLAWLWAEAPSARLPKETAMAAQLAEEGLAATQTVNAELARRFARFLALEHLSAALRPGAVSSHRGTGLATLVEHLDAAVGEIERAVGFARQAGDVELASRIDLLFRTRPVDEQGRSPAAAAARPATAAATETDSASRRQPASWREAFDQNLEDPSALDRAIALFETDPAPSFAPERGVFLAAAVERLVGRGETERAWSLLERDRLLGLQPPDERVFNPTLAGTWKQVRALRGQNAAYEHHLATAPALVRALEGRPATLTEVREALGDAVLLQVFAPMPTRWYWFAVDQREIGYIKTGPLSGTALHPEVSALLGARLLSRMVIDAGELLQTPAWSLAREGRPLLETAEITEALSATYFVAAHAARNLGRRGDLVVGTGAVEPETTVLRPERADPTTFAAAAAGRRIVEVDVESALQAAPAYRPGLAQVRFGAQGDLAQLGSASLRSSLAVAVRLPADVRAARAFAQAGLLAQIPTVIVGRYEGEPGALRAQLARGLATGRASSVFREIARGGGAAGLRLFGDPGLDAAARVDFGYDELLRWAKVATGAFKAAQASPSTALWRDAEAAFAELLDTIAFLREPASIERLLAAKDERKRKLPAMLANLEAVNQTNLAKVQLALDEVADAVAVLELVIGHYQSTGKLREAAQNTLALGRALSYGKRPREAAQAFARCAETAAQTGDGSTQADCLVRRGSELRTLFDYAGAIRAYEEAIAIYEDGGSPNEAYPRRYLGFLYESSLNNYDKALEQFRRALEVARRHSQNELAPSVLLDLARVYRLQGDYERALADVRHAERELKETQAQTRAEAAIEAAKIYWYRGNYRRALERQRHGLELARHAGSSFLEIQAESLAGLVALNEGELSAAEAAIARALDLARRTGRKSEEAAQLNNLGIVLREGGRLPEAIERFRAALAIDEAIGSVEGRAYDLRNLAVALQRQGGYAEAHTTLDAALELSRAIGNRYNELQCVFALGELLEATRDPAAAANYETAARIARTTAVPEVEWRARYGLGRLAEARGDIAAARQLFDAALKVAERLGRGRSESISGRGRDDLYDDAVRLAMGADDLDAAWSYMERARARALLDLLATRTIEFENREARNLLERELAAREAVLTAEREQMRAAAGAAAAVARAQRMHAEALAALRRSYPRLWRAFVIEPATVAMVQRLLPPKTFVLAYFVGERATTVLTVSAESVTGQRLPVGRRQLTDAARRIRAAMDAFAWVEPELETLAAELRVPQTLESIAGARTIVIVPHGPLYHVPFAALPLGKEPLLTRATIALSPSGSWLADRLADTRRPPIVTVAALAPAADLPFARLEATAVAGAAAAVGPDATEARLRALGVDAVDIAAHVELDAADPLGSAVLLSPGTDDDGRLEVREIFGLANVPALVSLTACHSLGSDVRGDEWVGLAAAFLTAGSRTVLASQSRLSDLAASVLVKRFYRLLRTQGPAEALRDAALWTRRYFAHPAHWASLLLLGDFR